MAQNNRRRAIDLPNLAADEAVVRELLQSLITAYENILNAYPDAHDGETVRYMDALMAVHNLHKIALHHVIDESGMRVVDALGFMRIMRDTFIHGVDTDMELLRNKTEGVRKSDG